MEQKPIQGVLLIRRSEPSDTPELERLAARDGRVLPERSFVVAELNDRLVAAASVDVDDEPISDPFLALAEACDWLAWRAAGIREASGWSARLAA